MCHQTARTLSGLLVAAAVERADLSFWLTRGSCALPGLSSTNSFSHGISGPLRREIDPLRSVRLASCMRK